MKIYLNLEGIIPLHVNLTLKYHSRVTKTTTFSHQIRICVSILLKDEPDPDLES